MNYIKIKTTLINIDSIENIQYSEYYNNIYINTRIGKCIEISIIIENFNKFLIEYNCLCDYLTGVTKIEKKNFFQEINLNK